MYVIFVLNFIIVKSINFMFRNKEIKLIFKVWCYIFIVCKSIVDDDEYFL